MEKLVFTLKLQEVPVEITDVDGTAKTFTLMELTSDQRSLFLNQIGKRVKVGAKGTVQGMSDYKYLQENLLTLCLKDENGDKISAADLGNYPAHVISELFKAAQTLSGMDLEGESEAKND
jgi:hypothetical protein